MHEECVKHLLDRGAQANYQKKVNANYVCSVDLAVNALCAEYYVCWTGLSVNLK